MLFGTANVCLRRQKWFSAPAVPRPASKPSPARRCRHRHAVPAFPDARSLVRGRVSPRGATTCRPGRAVEARGEADRRAASMDALDREVCCHQKGHVGSAGPCGRQKLEALLILVRSAGAKPSGNLWTALSRQAKSAMTLARKICCVPLWACATCTISLAGRPAFCDLSMSSSTVCINVAIQGPKLYWPSSPRYSNCYSGTPTARETHQDGKEGALCLPCELRVNKAELTRRGKSAAARSELNY